MAFGCLCEQAATKVLDAKGRLEKRAEGAWDLAMRVYHAILNGDLDHLQKLLPTKMKGADIDKL